MKKRLNVDGQQFYQYQQNEQSPPTPKSLNINKTTPYDVENPDIGLRQVQTCGEAKPISEIPPDNWISSASHLKKTAIFIYALLMISESLSLTYCLFTLLFPTQHDTEVKQVATLCPLYSDNCWNIPSLSKLYKIQTDSF